MASASQGIADTPHLAQAVLDDVVWQHVQEAAHLRVVRSVLVRAPHVRLADLARGDERLAAHLDGLAVAEAAGLRPTREALASAGRGELFVAAVRAIELRDLGFLDQVLAIAEALPSTFSGLVSAFGWVPASSLRGIVGPLLNSTSPWRRDVGLAACALHGVDPGAALSNALGDPDPHRRGHAWRVAGRGGQLGLLDRCLDALHDDPACAFEAALAALRLGDRHAALGRLESMAADPSGDVGRRQCALRAALGATSPGRARALLAALGQDAGSSRLMVCGLGVAGDPHGLPWLVERMADPALARGAGEAVSTITGLDLAALDLDRRPADQRGRGPSDDAELDDITKDADADLPLPDQAKIASWWQTNGIRFQSGQRYFMGAPLEPATCRRVLAGGTQRQRAAAAHHLCLLEPGTALFNTAAPAWRQQRRLAGRPSPA